MVMDSKRDTLPVGWIAFFLKELYIICYFPKDELAKRTSRIAEIAMHSRGSNRILVAF